MIYKRYFKKSRMQVPSYKILVLCALVMAFLCDSGTAVEYWLILFILNVDFINPPEVGGGVAACEEG